MFVAIVQDEREDFGRDSVDGCERVLQGPDKTEHFQHVALESVHLKTAFVAA